MIHEAFVLRDFHRNVRCHIWVDVDRSLRDFGQATVPFVVTADLVDIFASAVPDTAIETQDNVFEFVGKIRKQFHIGRQGSFCVILGKYETKNQFWIELYLSRTNTAVSYGTNTT